MILYILLIVLFALVLAGLLGAYKAREFGKNAVHRIKVLESKYEEYVEANLLARIEASSDMPFNTNAMAKEIVQYLKPDIEGLIHLVNNSYLSNVPVKYNAHYFPTLVTLCESAFTLSNENKDNRLQETDIAAFYHTVQDAVFADLQSRLLSLKVDDL